MTPTRRGRFITFEGGERTGKTTQVARLTAQLRADGLDVLALREPGGTPLGEVLREMVLGGRQAAVPRAEALMIAAARAQLVETVIAPALAEGRWVVCDRFADSSLAYQGAGLGLGVAAVRQVNDWATDGLWPDLTILLDVDPARAHPRQSGTDRIEQRSAAYHRTVRDAYLALSRAEPQRFLVVTAHQPPEAIEAQVLAAVRALGSGAAAGFPSIWTEVDNNR